MEAGCSARTRKWNGFDEREIVRVRDGYRLDEKARIRAQQDEYGIGNMVDEDQSDKGAVGLGGPSE
jgi:hypothetical protein